MFDDKLTLATTFTLCFPIECVLELDLGLEFGLELKYSSFAGCSNFLLLIKFLF